MKTLIFANNSPSVKRYVREIIDSLTSRFDKIYFISHSDKRFFKENKKVNYIQIKPGTSEEKYLRVLQENPEVWESSNLCFADDSIVYLFEISKLFEQFEGKSDMWALSVNRTHSVHPDNSLVYFDRDTAKAAIPLFKQVSLAGDISKQLASTYQKLMISGYSLNFLLNDLGELKIPHTIYRWDILASSEWPLVNKNLYSRSWRLDNFGIALPKVFRESEFLDMVSKKSTKNIKSLLADIE